MISISILCRRVSRIDGSRPQTPRLDAISRTSTRNIIFEARKHAVARLPGARTATAIVGYPKSQHGQREILVPPLRVVDVEGQMLSMAIPISHIVYLTASLHANTTTLRSVANSPVILRLCLLCEPRTGRP